MTSEDVSIFQRDRVGRAWVVCPSCDRKTPAWSGREVAKQGYCRWCGEKWVWKIECGEVSE